jgi:Iron dependent repressor, N-terminal DNA binding domain/FeoA domain
LTAQGLIDTTEMYLRTLFELEEEGVTPLRARIAQGPGQTGPAVSQTVPRMEVAAADGARVVIRRIGRPIQSDLALMHKLSRAGIQPGREVILMAAGDGVCVTAGSSADLSTVELPRPVAAHISVSGSSRYRPAAGA